MPETLEMPDTDTKPDIPPDLAAESLARIADAGKALEIAEEEEKEAKIEAREAKAKRERLRKELHRIIREETSNEPTLFNRPPPRTDAASTASATPDDGDDWRSVPLNSLGLPAGLLGKLAEANIETMGELSDWTDPTRNGGREKRLTDIKGIGPGAIEKIEAATTQFWAERNKRRAAIIVDEVADATDATGPNDDEDLVDDVDDDHDHAD